MHRSPRQPRPLMTFWLSILVLAGLLGVAAADAPGVGDLESSAALEDDGLSTEERDVLRAREHVARAESRERVANTAYGRMRQKDWPRGPVRIEIVGERDASREALEQAQRALAEAEERAS